MSSPSSSGHMPCWLLWTVLVTASLLLVGSVALAASGVWQSTAAAQPTEARSAGTWPTAGQPTSYTVPSTALAKAS